MTSHCGLLVLFAAFVSLVFATIAKDAPAEQAKLGLSLMGAFLLWVGSSDVGFSLPDADALFIVIAVALSASGLVIGLVPAVRRRVLPPLVEQARNAASSESANGPGAPASPTSSST